MHRNKFLVNKTNRCTEFQIYRYYYSTCFGQPFRPSSAILSRTSALVHFMQLCWTFATRSRMSSIMLLVANGSSQLHKMYQCRCTAKNSWWWAERLPETCRVVIPIILEFSASVGFIHKVLGGVKRSISLGRYDAVQTGKTCSFKSINTGEMKGTQDGIM